MWTKSERRWRKRGKRGVSPIIATILLVAITVVLAAVLYILISGLTKGPGSTPVGTALALGTPTPGKAGTTFFENFSIQSAGGGILWNNVNFQVQTSSGSIVTLGTGSTITVVNLQGASVATYPMVGASANTWTSGGTVGISSGQQIQLSNTASLAGDVLVVSGTGSFSGSISVGIPS